MYFILRGRQIINLHIVLKTLAPRRHLARPSKSFLTDFLAALLVSRFVFSSYTIIIIIPSTLPRHSTECSCWWKHYSNKVLFVLCWIPSFCSLARPRWLELPLSSWPANTFDQSMMNDMFLTVIAIKCGTHGEQCATSISRSTFFSLQPRVIKVCCRPVWLAQAIHRLDYMLCLESSKWLIFYWVISFSLSPS